MIGIAHVPVPAATPDEPESELQVTCVTLSVAVPLSATVAVPVVHCESAVGKARLSLGRGTGRTTASTVLVMSPLADTAVTVMVVVPGVMVNAGIVHCEVPSAIPPSPLSVVHWTAPMPDAWLARPVSAIDEAVVVNCAPVVGAEMRTSGGAAGASSLGCGKLRALLSAGVAFAVGGVCGTLRRACCHDASAESP